MTHDRHLDTASSAGVQSFLQREHGGRGSIPARIAHWMGRPSPPGQVREMQVAIRGSPQDGRR